MKQVLVLRHQLDVPMGSIHLALHAAGLEPRQFDLYESVPDDLPWNEAAGLIVLGGPMSANDGDKFPFLDRELDWLREAIERKAPTLGICLGAQLLAKALGGAVYRNSEPEIGWRQLELLPAAAEDDLFERRAASEIVFHWHNDTFDLPAGAVHLAQTAACRHQAFRMGNFAYGVQFHVEMTPAIMELWLQKVADGRSSCDPEEVDVDGIRAAAASAFPAMNSFSRCLLSRFAAFCKSQSDL